MRWHVKVETKGEQRRTEEQPKQVFHRLVSFVSRGFLFISDVYDAMELSLKACAFMTRSMLADQPYSEMVRTNGESDTRELMRSFSSLPPRTSSIDSMGGVRIQHSVPTVSSSRTRPQGPCLIRNGLELLEIELIRLLHEIFERTIGLLRGRQISIITKALVVIVDTEAELDHKVDAASKLC